MNKKDLVALGIAEDIADQIVVLHGKDIEKHKTAVDTSKTEAQTLKDQLTEANKQIESFKGLDIEGVKKSAEEYKVKYEQAEKDFASQLIAKDFERDLDEALVGARAKNKKSVKPLLSIDELKDANGKFIAERFNEQLGKVKPENDYLFESETKIPVIVTGGKNQPIAGNTFLANARKAAGLPEPK